MRPRRHHRLGCTERCYRLGGSARRRYRLKLRLPPRSRHFPRLQAIFQEPLRHQSSP